VGMSSKRSTSGSRKSNVTIVSFVLLREEKPSSVAAREYQTPRAVDGR